MAKIVAAREEVLYGVDQEFLNEPVIISKKDKKSEPKEYDLRQSYKHLNIILNEASDGVFEALYNASVVLK